MAKTLKLLTIISSMAFVAMFFLTVNAAPGSFTQTNWIGGAGQTAFTDSTKFLASNNTDFSNTGSIKLSGTTPNWYLGWDYRVGITIDETKVIGSANFSNYVLLVDITSSDFISKAQTDADDFVFTLQDGTSKLNHEIESYNNATGHLYAWVQIPTLSYNNNTSIYLYYGNNSATNQESQESTWASNFKYVEHFDETSGQHLDSTTNNNDSTSVTVTTQGTSTGKINGSDLFSGDPDIIKVPDNANGSLDVTDDNFALSFWFKTPGLGIDWQPMVTKGQASRNYGIWLAFDEIYVNWYSGNWRNFSTSTANIQPNQWYHVLYQRDGTSEYIYLNGIEAASQLIQYPMVPDDQILVIGGDPGFRFFEGNLDEIQIVDSALSPDLITTLFNNQSDPSSFYSVGLEEAANITYFANGTLTSSIFDSSMLAVWSNLTLEQAVPANTSIQVKARTSNLANLSDATDFASCDFLAPGNDISDNNCVNDYHRYIQYQVTLSTSNTSVTPTLNSIVIAFEDDQIAPVLSNVTSSVGPNSTTISWTTNELTSTQVKFGLDDSLGYMTSEKDVDSKVNTHQVVLTGLANCKMFYYKSLSKDAAGNLSQSDIKSFNTYCPAIPSNTNTVITQNVVSYLVSYVQENPTDSNIKSDVEIDIIPDTQISGNLNTTNSELNLGTLVIGITIGSVLSLVLYSLYLKKSKLS